MSAALFTSGFYPPAISVSDSLLSVADLRNKVWTDLQHTLDQAVADGRATPFLFPFAILGPGLLPFIWLVIPHTRRPWLYSMRWLVLAVIVAVDLDMLRWARSANPGFSYIAGLMGAWGILTSLNFIVWTRPQFEAARIVKRRKLPLLAGDEKASLKAGDSTSAILPSNSHKKDGDTLYEYIWQPFPEEGTLSERAGWVADLLINFRGVGWNCATSALPRPNIPRDIQFGTPVDIDSIPLVSRSGYTRTSSEREFVTSRLFAFAYMYLILDFLGVSILKDPYFVLGPNTSHLPLSGCLESLPDWVLMTYRGIFTLVGIWCGIGACTALNDLAQFYLFRNINPKYGEFWMYPSTNGSILSILDYGLAGFWGRVWHQTFRIPFSAPATYFVRHGIVKRDTALGAAAILFTAFLQSAFLHAAGSFAAIAQHAPWRAFVFFVLQAVGILIQQSLIAAAGKVLPSDCRLLSRVANVVFVLVWLNITGKLLADDLATGGIWLMEPAPVSILRLLGFGPRGDPWLRWHLTNVFKLHSGGPWWERGVAI